MNGIINFFKPKGMTSHGAVNFLRKKLNIKRIGHTGTLDPEVSGVLPLCIGKATRISEYLLNADKEYIGELTLGMETESQDAEGQVVNFSKEFSVSEDDIIQVFDSYLGEIKQIPPMYSALKHNGETLYKLAREGITVERDPRISYINELEVLKIDGNKVLFRVHCSKGTYIRTLCHDIGRDLGSYGYMSYLIRTAVYDFNISDSIGPDTILNSTMEDMEKFIQPMDIGIMNMPKIVVDKEKYKALSHGARIELKSRYIYDKDLEYRIYCRGKFMGIGFIEEIENKYYIRMRKVLLA